MGLEEKFDKMLGLVSGTNDISLLKTVLEVQQEMSKLLEENRDLRAKVHDLKNEKLIKSSFEYSTRDNIYYKKGDHKDEYFCPKCFDSETKESHMVLYTSGTRMMAVCQVCRYKVMTGIESLNMDGL